MRRFADVLQTCSQELEPVAYLLDHEYTRSSLDWHHLRGMDRDRVGELMACADHLGLTAHLSLADVHETWSTECDDYWRDRRSELTSLTRVLPANL